MHKKRYLTNNRICHQNFILIYVFIFKKNSKESTIFKKCKKSAYQKLNLRELIDTTKLNNLLVKVKDCKFYEIYDYIQNDM